MRNLLFINKGKLRFVEDAEARGIKGTKYSFVTDCFDFDEDGDVDLFVGNDYGRNDYYENLGKGRFRADDAHPFHLGSSFSMGISIADYDNTGSLAVSVSNMYSHAGNRIVPLAKGLTPQARKELLRVAAGNSLYEREDGRWSDQSKLMGVDNSDWAWGNIFFDVDNDADKDLYVATGYTSNTDPHLPDF